MRLSKESSAARGPSCAKNTPQGLLAPKDLRKSLAPSLRLANFPHMTVCYTRILNDGAVGTIDREHQRPRAPATSLLISDTFIFPMLLTSVIISIPIGFHKQLANKLLLLVSQKETFQQLLLFATSNNRCILEDHVLHRFFFFFFCDFKKMPRGILVPYFEASF